MGERIRWTEDHTTVPIGGPEPVWEGRVGNTDPTYLFLITKHSLGGDDYALHTELPWQGKRRSYGTNPDDLKAEAERWLSEFISSLGASFPDEPASDPDCGECGFGLPRHDKDCSHYREPPKETGQ